MLHVLLKVIVLYSYVSLNVICFFFFKIFVSKDRFSNLTFGPYNSNVLQDLFFV